MNPPPAIITVRPDRLEAARPALEKEFPEAEIFTQAGQRDEIIYWSNRRAAAEFMAGHLHLATCPGCGLEGPEHRTCPGPAGARGAVEE